MNSERRKFLQQLATMCGAGVVRTLGIGLGVGAGAAAAPGTTAVVAGAPTLARSAGPYGQGVRQQVLEVIARQAINEAPWREICKGPMDVNFITEEDVQREILTLSNAVHTGKMNCWCEKCFSERRAYNYRKSRRTDAIPHSPISPCACNDCNAAIQRTRHEIREAEPHWCTEA